MEKLIHINLAGPRSGVSRVARGGSWRHAAAFCRSAFHVRFVPAYRDDFLGFRLALTFGSGGKEPWPGLVWEASS